MLHTTCSCLLSVLSTRYVSSSYTDGDVENALATSLSLTPSVDIIYQGHCNFQELWQCKTAHTCIVHVAAELSYAGAHIIIGKIPANSLIGYVSLC